MALPKNVIPINFANGLDLKTDDKQVAPGKFLALENTVFTKGGLLQKRNGYGALTPLPDDLSLVVTTFNDNLTAIGPQFQAFSESTAAWVDKGNFHPLLLSTLPLIRSNTNQSQVDAAIAPNGLVCTVYTDNIPSAGSNIPSYRYAVANSVTGQNIVAPTIITPTSGTVSGPIKVFLLKNHFVIMFTNTIGGTHHLQYIALNVQTPSQATANTDISALYTPEAGGAFDAYVINNTLYVGWQGSDGSFKMTFINPTLSQGNTVSFTGHQVTLVSVTADATGVTPVIYATFSDPGASTVYTLAVNQDLTTVLAPTSVTSSTSVVNITSVAQNSVCTLFTDVATTYSYDSSLRTDVVFRFHIAQGGTVTGPVTVERSVGLASKAFLIDSIAYFLAIYGGPSDQAVFQPTYFLVDQNGNIVSKLAYSNGGSYYTGALPSVTVTDNVAQVSYFYKDLITAVNKTQGVANTLGIYSQTGLNLASFTVGGTSQIITSEIGSDLHLSGGFLWMYDGYTPVEHLFHVWPDYVEATTVGSGGSISAQTYFYVATYEWADNQGNVFRSAPSIPFKLVVGAASSTNTIHVPTLRLTYKIANPVKIVLYRWSAGQPVYYEVTSVLTPLLNDVTIDYVSFVDTQADADILGNTILYTTGNVVENIAAPATQIISLFQSRLVLVDAEDPNLIWFSKQVIEATPVEMSDLLTMYIAPTTGAQGSTGPITALSAMDDKLIIFKKDAIYYVNGTGPDNTGANNQFSEPIFITATVGCINQNSIVFMPNGLMFQSDKGIWLLGRDLSTSYIGAPVETLVTGALVQSALNIPATNEVRFTLSTGVTLMYDYYYGQWGTFGNVPAISSTLYKGLHTYINSRGAVFQETPGTYLDGSSPVLMSFTTSWFNLAGLQGFERAYFFYLLGSYISPHRLALNITYDYNPGIEQQIMIQPDNLNANWGDQALWGSGDQWGGNPALEQWRIFLNRQKCQSFQIQLQEIYDSSFGIPAGAGLTMSGLALVVGQKRGYTTLKPNRSAS